ncbi:Digeranylgeranylglycerophospholipid reductase [uncultured Desulfobacterium sp.]|uniref:Digeranylgeranylglycerophospholipid reductase n=1 Tax=uncultured Desulfobacterium sp. TaxID=201089 RepID=A0A445MZG0_9BACT|nr:Digeranylgeranylglycerophospholipid reductase [uncultured Desulfobacterium sp.]
MNRDSSYDLVVVGAGPAGLMAAETASSQGIRTLVIEKKSTIGLPVRCAGYVPRLQIRGFDFDKRCIIQHVDKMITYTPWGEVVETKAPGYLIERGLFDKSLALSAISKGADIMIKTRFRHLFEGGVILKKAKEEIRIKAKVIVGADGPVSTVGEEIGKRNVAFISAAQCEVLLNHPLEVTEVYFDSQYTGGYAWLFPRGKTAYVGVGIRLDIAHRPENALKHFVNLLSQAGRIRKNSTVGYTCGLIPVGGYLDGTLKENVLLVGDAAGQTDAITGAGIPQAVICGKIAGDVAAKAIKENDLMILGEYEKRWKDLFGKSLNRAFEKRKLLDTSWKDEELDIIIKKTWVAFDAYWRG